MTERETGESTALSELIRRRLVHGFGDYHTSIREQIVLVDQLIEAVRQEERDRCAALVDAMRMPPASP